MIIHSCMASALKYFHFQEIYNVFILVWIYFSFLFLLRFSRWKSYFLFLLQLFFGRSKALPGFCGNSVYMTVQDYLIETCLLHFMVQCFTYCFFFTDVYWFECFLLSWISLNMLEKMLYFVVIGSRWEGEHMMQTRSPTKEMDRSPILPWNINLQASVINATWNSWMDWHKQRVFIELQ